MKKKTLPLISFIFVNMSLSLFAMLSPDDEKINANIHNYTPAYVELKDAYTADYRSILHETTFKYEIKLENQVNVNPTPWSKPMYLFLGYTDNNTIVVLTETVNESWSRTIAKVPLTPGVHTLTDVETHGYGKTNITITIQPSTLAIKVKNSGYFWNSYDDADIYKISFKIGR